MFSIEFSSLSSLHVPRAHLRTEKEQKITALSGHKYLSATTLGDNKLIYIIKLSSIGNMEQTRAFLSSREVNFPQLMPVVWLCGKIERAQTETSSCAPSPYLSDSLLKIFPGFSLGGEARRKDLAL